MVIIPAIELRDGKCVRFGQGEFMKRQSFPREPVALAQYWQAEGAEYLHIFDWDGAREGKPVNGLLFRKMAEALHIPIEVKGGVRQAAHVEELLEAGVQRVVLEETALADRAAAGRIFEKYQERVAASIRARDGMVLLGGWAEPTDVKAADLALAYKDHGLITLLYKDLTGEDGEENPCFPQIQALKETTGLRIIASGGISSLNTVRRLKENEIDGAVIAKALYNGALNFKNALAFARQ